jgi:Ca2+-transporting ATPase
MVDAIDTSKIENTLKEITTDDGKSPVTLRVLSADLLETAKAVALSCHIIDRDTFDDPAGEGFCITGDEFETKLTEQGLVVDYFNELPIDEKHLYEEWYKKQIMGINTEQENTFTEQEKESLSKEISQKSGLDALGEICRRVKVLAECNPKQKKLFIKGFRQIGAAVLMAGESITDQEALKAASVGVSLSDACDVSKDNADLVLMQNDFQQIKAAVMWGRQLYMNVQKFLVFQLTVNVVVVITCLVGGAIGHLPFNVLQMLWINLIMDIFGAIALCTEPWADGVKLPRVKRTSEIMNPSMWKLIIIQALYQIIVLVVLMFFYGAMAYGKDAPNLFTTPLRRLKDGVATNRLKMDTFIYHTFVLMSIFNQINCRNIDSNNMNPFANIQNHFGFIFIFCIEITVQQFMVLKGSDKLSVASVLLGTGHISHIEQIVCYVLGLLVIPIGLAAKKIPDEAFSWTAAISLEDPEADDLVSQWHGRMVSTIEVSRKVMSNPDSI